MGLDSVTGIITNYIYKADDSLYKIASFTTSDNEKLTIVGYFPLLEENLSYKFTGEYRIHKTYGKELFVESYSKGETNSLDGLVLYLSSEKFKGIGLKTATKIVQKLGSDCINKIVDDKEVLKGLVPVKQADMIYDILKDNFKSEEVFAKLFSYGLSSKMVYKLFEKYSILASDKVIENPYRLIYEVDGFGFRKSDNLALNIGFKETDSIRIKEAILYTLDAICNQNGFTFLTEDQLINSSVNVLNKNVNVFIDDSLVKTNLESLKNEGKIIFDSGNYFNKRLYDSEVKTSDRIKLMLAKEKSDVLFDKQKIKNIVLNLEETLNIKYTDLQKEAIVRSLSSKLSIITGGPGTGKTTVIKGIINTYAHLVNASVTSDTVSFDIKLLAPTGRAAKRMSEATGLKATTIHKGLGYNYDGGFTLNEYNPMFVKLLIIDEASMIDIELAANLFKAIPLSCQVIFVGDENQLPSVGPGAFLHDIIASNTFQITRLKEVMRQEALSNIIKLSKDVLYEHLDFNMFKEHKEVFYYPSDSTNVSNVLIKIMDAFVNKGGDINKDIQVLIPMYAGVAGIDVINNIIQERYNKSPKVLVRGDKLFKVNDKVLQLKNDQKYEIMNGDIGTIIDIINDNDKSYLLIEFDERVISYDVKDLDNLCLAYAISVHKSQGSEYKNVIMPIVKSYQVMLKKKILYTAITRAKEKLIIIGDYSVLLNAVKNKDSNRQTTLTRLLSNVVSTTVYINDPDIPFDTLGETDMEGITPYSFM